MKSRYALVMLLVFALLLPVWSNGQKTTPESTPAVFSYDAEETVITISKQISPSALDSIIVQFQLQELSISEVLISGRLKPEVLANNWSIRTNNAEFLQLVQKHEPLAYDSTSSYDMDAEQRWEDRLMLTEHFIKDEINFYHFYPTALLHRQFTFVPVIKARKQIHFFGLGQGIETESLVVHVQD